MLKNLLLSASLLCVCLATGCASIRVVERGQYERVTLETLETEGERLVPQMLGEGLVVFVEKGRQVPLEMSLRSSVLSAQTTGATVTAERDLYLFISAKGLMLSPDGERFAPAQNERALKKLFGLNGGQFALGFGVTRDEGAKVTLLIESR